MSGDEEVLRRLQMAPERNRLQKLNQALEDGMVEARFLDREKVLLDCVRYLLAGEDPTLVCELLGWLP
jgi:hypothetical protein